MDRTSSLPIYLPSIPLSQHLTAIVTFTSKTNTHLETYIISSQLPCTPKIALDAHTDLRMVSNSRHRHAVEERGKCVWEFPNPATQNKRPSSQDPKLLIVSGIAADRTKRLITWCNIYSNYFASFIHDQISNQHKPSLKLITERMRTNTKARSYGFWLLG